MSVDMRKVSFETNAGSFEGRIEVMVNDTEHLGELLDRLRDVPASPPSIARRLSAHETPWRTFGFRRPASGFPRILPLESTDMKVDVLLGLQWGDEEGKIVDVLTPQYDIIARFQGGPNAGHTSSSMARSTSCTPFRAGCSARASST